MAAPSALESDEIQFAKRLANNEKTHRDKAVRKLRRWLSSRPKDTNAFTEEEMMRLWKGLFYCMWMSDKPLIQEELAGNLSTLMHCFQNHDTAVMFIDCFFKTIMREWHGIDRLRLDKFYMLIRKFINQCFELAKNKDWEESIVKRLQDVFTTGPLCVKDNTKGVEGVCLHVCAVYLEELEKVAKNKIPVASVSHLIDPLCQLAVGTKSKVVLHAVRENFLGFIENLAADHSNNNEGDEEAEKKLPVNFTSLGDSLFSLASDPQVLGRNRKIIYNFAESFRKIGKQNEKENNQVSKIPDTEIKQDQNVENSSTKRKRKRRKANKNTKACTEDNNESITLKENNTGSLNGVGEEPVKDSDAEVAALTPGENSEKKEEDEQGPRKKRRRRKKGKSSIVETCPEPSTEVVDTNENGLEILEQKMETTKGSQDEVTDEGKGNKAEIVDKEIVPADDNESKSKVEVEAEVQKEISEEPKVSKAARKRKRKSKAICEENPVNEQTSEEAPAPEEVPKKDTVDAEEKAQTPKKKKNAKDKGDDGVRPFMSFQKVNQTPPAFVRKAALKTTPKSEPKRFKQLEKKQTHTPGSVPHKGYKKKVKIALSKNEAYTTTDYQKKMKESPSVPFNPQDEPIQGLLKPSPATTPSLGKKTKLRPTKRAKAADFF